MLKLSKLTLPKKRPYMISIILPSYNKVTRLYLTLRVLAESVMNLPFACEVIVVNDGSIDHTADLLSTTQASFPVSFSIVTHIEVRGRSCARNAGAQRANGTRLLFIDDDVLVSKAVLTRHYQLGASRVLGRGTILNLPWLRKVVDPLNLCANLPERLAERVQMLIQDGEGLLERVAPHARRSSFERDLHRLLAHSEHRWLASTGGNLSVSTVLFHELNGFDEQLGLRWGVEDLEFGYRAEQAGAEIIHLDDVAIYHLDHEIANREADHEAALDYFRQKHGEQIGQRLLAYFAGDLAIEAVGI